MPKFPIYTNLLPKEAQEVIGRPHDNTAPAKALLEKEGFRYRGAVDIFDAGPCLEAARDEIHTVRQSQKLEVHLVSKISGNTKYLVANASLDNFRITQTVATRSELGLLEISRDAAAELELKDGDLVIIAPSAGQKN